MLPRWQTGIAAAALVAIAFWGLLLDVWLPAAALVVVAASAWAYRAWQRSFLAIKFPGSLSANLRLIFLLGVAVELIIDWVSERGRKKGGKPARPQRWLDGFEATAVAGHEVAGAFLISNVVTIEPAVSADALREAAVELQRRHALLRAVVVPGPWPSFAVPDDWREVEVQEFDCSAEEAVDLHVREGICSSFCSWRLGLCGSDMIFTYHHAFLDGTSVMTILEELLMLLHAHAAGIKAEFRVPTIDQGELPPAPRSLLPWHVRLRHAPGCTDKAQAWSAEPARPQVPGASYGRWQEDRLRFLHRRLGPCETERLRAACRGQGTTVAGALGAAMLRQVGALVASGRPVLCRTLVNMRPHFGLDPRSLGSCLGWVDTLLEPGESFWDDARSYKAAASELIQEGRHLWPSACWPAGLYPFEGLVGAMRQIWASPTRPSIRVSFGLSSRGCFRLETPTHRMTAVHFVRQQRGLGQEFFELNACTVNGTLCLTFVYYDQLCPQDVAEGLMDRVLRDVAEAAADTMPEPPGVA